MPLRLRALALAAGLTAVAAAPAHATEGPLTGGPPLPNTLQPVGFPPAGQPPSRAVRPRVLTVRVKPQRVTQGHRARLRIALAGPGKVRVIVTRRGQRVSTRTVTFATGTRTLRSSARLRPGRYRIAVVALDAQGRRAHAVRRTLVVVPR